MSVPHYLFQHSNMLATEEGSMSEPFKQGAWKHLRPVWFLQHVQIKNSFTDFVWNISFCNKITYMAMSIIIMTTIIYFLKKQSTAFVNKNLSFNSHTETFQNKFKEFITQILHFIHVSYLMRHSVKYQLACLCVTQCVKQTYYQWYNKKMKAVMKIHGGMLTYS
jgi:hypothetical protein